MFDLDKSVVPVLYVFLDCGTPPSPSNADIIPDYVTTYGAIVTYDCAVGYYENGGSNTSTCNSTGDWEGVPIVCTIQGQIGGVRH